jgi:microcystin-dependent protein
MATPINITFQVGTLAPAQTYTPQTFAEAIASILAGTINPDTFVPGVSSASAPSTDKGIFLDISTTPPSIKLWNGSTYVGDQTQLPIGGTIFWPGAGSIPSNYLVCDGTAKSKSLYPSLYTALGGASSPYGQTSTDFTLPPMSRKTAYGSGTGTGDQVAWNIGDSIGAESVQLVPMNLPAHTHDLIGSEYADGEDHEPNKAIIDEDRSSSTNEDPSAVFGGGNGEAEGDPFDTISPGIVGRWIIRAL